MKFKDVLDKQGWNDKTYKLFCKKVKKDFESDGLDLDNAIPHYAEDIISGDRDLKTYLEKLTKEKEMKWLKGRLIDDISGAK